ncbi:hypothetical protein [Prochlorococcus sp. MIT 1223]|uniref:hypothetical protein n=1 Tax=Prochlorococcus sp. MIT 1223 TaxID=3096217 RepID=UPI002A75B0E8|nr:hypothetical protein [Prochlorococcus sp. MIT 1223]
MFNSLFALTQFNLIWIGIPSILLLVFITILFFRKTDKKFFIAKDGSRFITKEECEKYDSVLEKINRVLQNFDNASSSVDDFGLTTDFIQKLKSNGFNNGKQILKHREEFKTLVDIIYNQ